MCLRDSYGAFIAASSISYPQYLPIAKGEALCLLYATQWSTSLSLDSVLFEMDCKVVVDLVNSPKEDLSELGDIIRDCHAFFSSLPNLNVRFIRRQANRVAHTLARATPSLSGTCDFYQVPHYIASLAMNEMH